jgi:amino acid transporter
MVARNSPLTNCLSSLLIRYGRAAGQAGVIMPGNSPALGASDVGIVDQVLARNRLGAPSVVFFVVAAAAPLTVIAGGAVTAVEVTGVTAIPIGYLVMAVILALFAVGYVTMSRYLVNAGAFYAYIARGLGRVPGVGAAAVALLAYNAMQVGLYGALGYVSTQILSTLGLHVAWWVCALAGWLVVAILGLLDVGINGRVLAVMLIAEFVVVVIYDAVMISHPAGGTVRFDTLQPAQLADPAIAAVLVVALAGFVGVEATVVFAEETRNSTRTIARATYIAIAMVGLLYGLSTWAISVATGPDQFVARAHSDGAELIFNLVEPSVGRTLVDVGHVLFLTSLFAALLAFHHTVARYSFALGRERVLPRSFGRVVQRTGAPKLGSMAQSVVGLVVIVFYAAGGFDPMTTMFGRLTAWGGLGVLLLMTFTSFAIIGFFARNPRGEPVWRRLVAPLLAGLLLALLSAITIANFGRLLNEQDSALGWLLPAAYLFVAVVGIAWAVVLRLRRPAAFCRIGLGVQAEVAQAEVEPGRPAVYAGA